VAEIVQSAPQTEVGSTEIYCSRVARIRDDIKVFPVRFSGGVLDLKLHGDKSSRIRWDTLVPSFANEIYILGLREEEPVASTMFVL
jgi:hypothetical protein